ncbi:hypothetical protein [Capnocytophaga gingivalis]|uniref:hypothetical protein n=1 Tax=Capnocytophaga gingivalis TaxID=1017 RepID=UPI003C77427B
MRRLVYAFCAAVCALFVMVSCSKSDKNEPKRFDIPSEAKAIISEDFIAKMAANGMTINEGTNPPNIEGIFATGVLKMIYTSLEKDFPIGVEIESYRFKFYDQVGTKVKTDYVNEAFINEEQATGRGTIISGNGNKFTAYLDMNIIDSGIKTRDVSVLSGEITPNGIKNFQYGFLKIEKIGDTRNKLVPEGTIRIWVSKNKLAVKKQQYPTGD